MEIIEQRFAEINEARGLTLRETLVMIAANERETPQGHLAAVLGINKNIMVKLIDRMEEKGLVRRKRNPKNRRGYVIENTPKAKKIVRYFHGSHRQQTLQTVLCPLSPEEAEQAIQWACSVIDAHYKKLAK